MTDVALPQGQVVDVQDEASLMDGERYILVNTSEKAVIYWALRPVGDPAPDFGSRPRVPIYTSQISDAGYEIQASLKMYAWAQSESGILTLIRTT